MGRSTETWVNPIVLVTRSASTVSGAHYIVVWGGRTRDQFRLRKLAQAAAGMAAVALGSQFTLPIDGTYSPTLKTLWLARTPVTDVSASPLQWISRYLDQWRTLGGRPLT